MNTAYQQHYLAWNQQTSTTWDFLIVLLMHPLELDTKLLALVLQQLEFTPHSIINLSEF